MINHLAIRNFKSIGEPGVDLELRPFTFFVGPNGGGKSSILEAIAIGCCSTHDVPQALIGYARDISLFYRKDLKRKLQIEVGFDPPVVTESGEGLLLQIPSLTFQAADLETERDANLVGSSITGPDFWSFFGAKVESPIQGDAESIRYAMERSIAPKVFLVASTRGLLPNERRANEAIPRWVGRNGEHTIPLLAVLSRPENQGVKSEIGETMAKFGMADPWAGWQGESFLGGQYIDPELKVALDTAIGSSGTRQALSVVTQVAWSKPGSLVMIEEPEISLHPEAQVEMCRFLAKHAAQGKQIIVTTHSQFMLLALQKPIQEGIISSSDVALYQVERNRDAARGEIGATIADPLPFAKEGYLEEWVPSFSAVERQLAREWVATLDRTESRAE